MEKVSSITPVSRTFVLVFSLFFFALFSLRQEQDVLREVNGSIDGLQSEPRIQHAVVAVAEKNLDDEEDEVTMPAMNATQQVVVDTPPPPFDPNNLCSAFSGTSRASRLWKDHLEEILQLTKVLPDDDLVLMKDLLETVLTPSRMRRAVQHLPTFRHEQLSHVMEILKKRLLDDANNPPLRIAIFGGSVTIGRDCVEGKMQHRECAWPNRLEKLVNGFFGKNLIQVYNLAIGGTNSRTATNRIKYWMYGDPNLDKIGPDVIVNSYSTNDSLPPWGKQWPQDDLIALTREKIHSHLEQFVREALTSKPPCERPPLIVHVDDYLGPTQPALLGELTYVSEMTQLAKYYDTVGISYGEVVRDITYQDHTETNFHKHDDSHYGRVAHTTIALSVAFASLELWINYCDDDDDVSMEHDTTSNGDSNTIMTKEQMKEKKLFLPPPLTKELLKANATNEFNAALENSYKAYREHECLANNSSSSIGLDRNPCTIAWISTPGNWNSDEIARFMNQYQTFNNGWGAERQSSEGWSNKDGWIANQPNATFALEFEATTTKSIKTISVYFLRSYGEKWKDSNARFTITRSSNSNNNTVLAQHEIAGVHADEDYHYSLTLSETIVLSEPVTNGEKLTMTVDLVSGGHFKIMGLMLCNK